MVEDQPNLVLQSDPNSIEILESFLNNLIEKYDVNKERYPDILISLTEAVNNAIIHGNKEDRSKLVRIYHCLEESNLCIKVCDQGAGFNPEIIQDPTCPTCREIPGGRGVFLMEQLADEIKFLDQGTKVELKFRI